MSEDYTPLIDLDAPNPCTDPAVLQSQARICSTMVNFQQHPNSLFLCHNPEGMISSDEIQSIADELAQDKPDFPIIELELPLPPRTLLACQPDTGYCRAWERKLD